MYAVIQKIVSHSHLSCFSIQRLTKRQAELASLKCYTTFLSKY